MTALAIIGALALLVQIAAYLFVIAALMLGATMLVGAAASRWFRWINSRRLRVDFGPHESRGWKT